MKITEFDRVTCKQMRQEIDQALATVGQKYGLTIDGGNISFTGKKFTMRLTVSVLDKTMPVGGKTANDFNLYCRQFGLEPSDMGRVFTNRGEAYKVVGLKPQSYKFPILGERYDGKRFKFMAITVTKGLGKELK